MWCWAATRGRPSARSVADWASRRLQKRGVRPPRRRRGAASAAVPAARGRACASPGLPTQHAHRRPGLSPCRSPTRSGCSVLPLSWPAPSLHTRWLSPASTTPWRSAAGCRSRRAARGRQLVCAAAAELLQATPSHGLAVPAVRFRGWGRQQSCTVAAAGWEATAATVAALPSLVAALAASSRLHCTVLAGSAAAGLPCRSALLPSCLNERPAAPLSRLHMPHACPTVFAASAPCFPAGQVCCQDEAGEVPFGGAPGWRRGRRGRWARPRGEGSAARGRARSPCPGPACREPRPLSVPPTRVP